MAQSRTSALKSLLIAEGVRTLSIGGLGLRYDLFKVTSSNEALREAAQTLAAQLPDDLTVLVAPGLGAAGLAAAIALQLDRSILVMSVRDPKKLRDGERLVEGALPEGAHKACFVDDTITTGATYRATVDALRERAPNVEIACCAILLDAWHPSSRAINASGVPVYSSLRRHDINLTRDCVSSAAGGARVNVFGDLLLDVPVASLDGTRQASNPLLCGSLIITADSTHTVRAHDHEGNLLWSWRSKHTRPKGIVQNLALQTNGTLLVAGYGGMVARLTLDGTLVRQTFVSHAVHSTPTVDQNGDIYVACEEWDSATKQPGGSIVRLTPNGVIADKHRYSDDFAPARCTLFEDTVIVTANDSVVRCLSKADLSHERWQLKLPGMVRGEITAADHFLYLATESGHVMCVAARTGEVRWVNHIAAGFVGAIPCLFEDKIVVCDITLHAHALDVSTGKRRWITRFRSAVRQRPTRMTADKWLFVGRDGDVNLVDVNTGAKLAQSRTNTTVLQPGDYRDGRFATLTAEGRLQIRRIVESLN